jgi:hypothetical protein
MDDIAAGDSPEQRAAESVMLGALSAELQVRLAKKRMVHAEGAWAELDGWSHDPPILVEVWAHQGIPKSAQKAKVMTDALKMLWVEATFYPAGARKILLLSDPAAAAHFGRMSWMARRCATSRSRSKWSTCPPSTGRRFRRRKGASSGSQGSEHRGGEP